MICFAPQSSLLTGIFRARLLRSECLPCAVFKVRARSLSRALSFRFREPSKRYRSTSFSQYINWSYGLLHFRFACLPCYLIPWLGSGVSGFSFLIPHSQFPILRYRPKVSALRSGAQADPENDTASRNNFFLPLRLPLRSFRFDRP